MHSKMAFWRKKSISNPNSPDTNTRRVIPTLTHEEWKKLPSAAKGYLIKLGKHGFEEIDFPIFTFEFKSLSQLNVDPPHLTITRVCITIKSDDPHPQTEVYYCYLYKRIGSMLFKFVRLEDWFEYFEGWDYVGNQVFEKCPDNDEDNDGHDDGEISFRPALGYEFPNREDFQDDLLEETVLQHNETHDPTAIAQNSTSSGDGIPSSQAHTTVLKTPAGPVRIEVQSNAAYYDNKHSQEASEQQDLAAIRNQAQPSSLVCQQGVIRHSHTLRQGSQPRLVLF